ncbi:MAG: nucleotidyltransferase domain-containing protein [Proteobacteria bacterium]|jgi:predicted nucleotidyltransferase|nr:nucleotidyltransferase domain-containing protein [Pseudomonadota bacterium]
MKFGLPDKTIDMIHGVFKKYKQIDKAVLYGSRAKGNYKNGSDIDLTLFGDGLDYKLQMDIFDDLDELLLPYMIDLSVYYDISNDELKEHIDRVGVVFYERKVKQI